MVKQCARVFLRVLRSCSPSARSRGARVMLSALERGAAARRGRDDAAIDTRRADRSVARAGSSAGRGLVTTVRRRTALAARAAADVARRRGSGSVAGHHVQSPAGWCDAACLTAQREPCSGNERQRGARAWRERSAHRHGEPGSSALGGACSPSRQRSATRAGACRSEQARTASCAARGACCAPSTCPQRSVQESVRLIETNGLLLSPNYATTAQ
jgi:hypothetical protein